MFHDHSFFVSYNHSLSQTPSAITPPSPPVSPITSPSPPVSPERPLHINPHTSLPLVKLALPKGRMEEGVFKLLNDAGVGLKVESRGYRPTMVIPGFDIKVT